MLKGSTGVCLESKQLGRIVDQHELTGARVGRDLGDEIGELAVVGHLARLVVGVRPVGAPDDVLGRVGRERGRERQGFFVRMRVLGDAVATGELDPDGVAILGYPGRYRLQAIVDASDACGKIVC